MRAGGLKAALPPNFGESYGSEGSASAAECTTCDGDGWYTPRFSQNVIVNCAACNREMRSPPGWEDWDEEDDDA